MADPSLYEVLGVKPDATDADIKRAYRTLAQTWHPDRDGGDEAEFKKIGNAYEILSNPEKRKLYDEGKINAQGGKEQSDEEVAIAGLQVMVKTLMTEPGDLVKAVQNALDMQRSMASSAEAQARRRRVQLEKKLKQIIFKGKGVNIVSKLIEAEILSQREQETQAVKAQKLFELASKLWKDYEDVSEPEAGNTFSEGTFVYGIKAGGKSW